MANRFWVLGTGTWDASDTTHWSATSNGAPLASVPGTADNVVFDGSSGGGTVTVNANHSISSLTTSAFTGTLDFATNNNTVNIGTTTPASVAWIDTGSGTHTVNMGSNTWTIDANSTLVSLSGANLTLTAGTSTIVLIAQKFTRTITNSKTLNNLTFSGAAGAEYTWSGTGTYNVVTANAPCLIGVGSGATHTITTLTLNGSSSTAAILLRSTAVTAPLLAVTNAVSTTWGVFSNINFSSAALTATNSIDMGGMSGATITAPSGGGGTTVVGVIGS